MNIHLKRLLSILLIVVIVLSACMGLTEIFRPVYTDDAVASVRSFSMMPENSLDVIVYGSSHSWLGIDTHLLNEKYGLDAYNYSCMWQSINTVDLFVNDSFNTQSPSLAIVDVGRVNEILRDADLNGEIYYTRELKDNDFKLKYLRDCFSNDKKKLLSYYLPFSMFHSNWASVSDKSFADLNLEAEDFVKSRGFMGFDIVTPVTVLDDSTYWEEPLSDDMRRYLDDIVDVCAKHGTQVLFVAVPFYSVEYMYRDAMTEYAREKGCDYLDFFGMVDELGIKGEEDFYDAEHLNLYGADKLTDYLGQYIIDNY